MTYPVRFQIDIIAFIPKQHLPALVPIASGEGRKDSFAWYASCVSLLNRTALQP